MLIVLVGFVFTANPPKAPVIFELVAGQGDNYMATEATALGSEKGVKFDVPMPAPAPTPPVTEPVPPEPTPVPPAPQPQSVPLKAVAPPAPTRNATKAPSRPKTIAQTLQHALIVGESRVKMKDLREKREREKQEKARKQALAKEQGMSYDQFLKNERTADAGLARGKPTGVVHGRSMEAGAGGHALTAQQQDALMAWAGMLKQRWRDNFVAPPDADGKATASVSFYVSGEGAIGRIRIAKSSGSASVDAAIMEALGRVHVPAPPTRKGDEYTTEFEVSESQ